MNKLRKGAADASAVHRAVGILLRLANFDLKDAGLLSSGGSPANAPALIRLAFRRLMLAVIATERGWPLPPAAADLDSAPDTNPLKTMLTNAAKGQPGLQEFPGVGRNGDAALVPDRCVIRAAILSTSALLKDLAGQFEVDLLGEALAGRASPIRLDPVVSPPLHSPPVGAGLPGRRKAASGPVSASTKLLTDSPPPDLRKTERPPVIMNPPEPTPLPMQQIEPSEIAGRSPIELTKASNSTTSTVLWTLMDAWGVDDMQALALIGHPEGLTKKGTRPRFKLVGDEVTMFRGLKEIASALTSLQVEPRAWLTRPIKAAPFGGITPLAYLIEQRVAGVRDTIRFILQQGLKLSMSSNKNSQSGASA